MCYWRLRSSLWWFSDSKVNRYHLPWHNKKFRIAIDIYLRSHIRILLTKYLTLMLHKDTWLVLHCTKEFLFFPQIFGSNHERTKGQRCPVNCVTVFFLTKEKTDPQWDLNWIALRPKRKLTFKGTCATDEFDWWGATVRVCVCVCLCVCVRYVNFSGFTTYRLLSARTLKL